MMPCSVTLSISATALHTIQAIRLCLIGVFTGHDDGAGGVAEGAADKEGYEDVSGRAKEPN